jgi:predicted AlkP superfamily pyrophosphatase or phosphodiesterase
VLNICLDVPRYIAEHYGADSIEYEDTLYSIDAMLAEFLGFLYAQFPSREDLVVVLTSDGGISPTHLDNNDGERFNSRQFEVILNAFLGARYGQDSWIAGYFDGSLYLNHDVVYRHKQTLSDIQNEVATFALQFRGVANAITATALRNAQFTRNEMSLVQSGYNPRTSGDVMILLEPKRIERSEMKVAMSGSIYHYDRHIPLIICGGNITPTTTGKRVSNDQIAPTIARLLNISSPLCATGNVIEIR